MTEKFSTRFNYADPFDALEGDPATRTVAVYIRYGRWATWQKTEHTSLGLALPASEEVVKRGYIGLAEFSFPRSTEPPATLPFWYGWRHRGTARMVIELRDRAWWQL